ncbi:MAG TPA: prepilin-type N-terminal cleavage/methylation domain-containing protein, partial [Rhodanobacter sp.]|nr:prepilin-type N-terminal cleavage/methylation domain-containing protein [Rhodanobacter sp.]
MAIWQRNNSPGFTLVEVLVAMTIVAVSLLA